jgi:hypothetical protein
MGVHGHPWLSVDVSRTSVKQASYVRYCARVLMQAWADMLDEMKKPKSEVMPIGRRRSA